MTLSRRALLTFAGASAGTVLLADPLKRFYTNLALGKSVFTAGFGELIPDPKGIIDLPSGFTYQVMSYVGQPMSDGHRVPTAFDGMASFAGDDGTIILVRNHELSPDQFPAVTAKEGSKYDKLSHGGTTTVILERDRTLIRQYVSLAGTNRNCAGGSTPWGSWISCEEDTTTPRDNFDRNPLNVTQKHGYNFEIPAKGEMIKPLPLTAMGRFRHEAIAVDPQTGYIYQTEDQLDSCLYRFRPTQRENLLAGGILEALVIEGKPKIDTSVNFPLNQPYKVKWVTIEDRDPDEDTLRYEAQSKGAAIFRRGEGICYTSEGIYWTCTNGGKAGRGQIFRYNLATETVELFVESPNQDILDYPDNLILAPFGDLIVCEDGEGEQFLVGITPQGKCYHFARNAVNNSEFAGVCFSPDGQTMFVNIYYPGLTLAIWKNEG